MTDTGWRCRAVRRGLRVGVGVLLALVSMWPDEGRGRPFSEVAGVAVTASEVSAFGMPEPGSGPGWWRVREQPMSPDRLMERDIFNAINAKRIERRLPPLEWDERIAVVARLHTQYLADSNKLDHRGQGGSRLQDRIKNLSWTEAGENLARNQGYPDPVAQAVIGWIKSPGHAENLYSPRYRKTGVGVVRKPDGFYYFTQVFTRPPAS